jgi:hypothetical protein
VTGDDDRVEHTFVVATSVERAWQAFTDGAERSRWEAPEYADDLPVFERTDLWPFQIARRPGDHLSVVLARDGACVRGDAPLRAAGT